MRNEREPGIGIFQSFDSGDLRIQPVLDALCHLLGVGRQFARRQAEVVAGKAAQFLEFSGIIRFWNRHAHAFGLFLIRQILDHIRARHTAAIKHKMNTLGTIQVAQARQGVRQRPPIRHTFKMLDNATNRWRKIFPNLTGDVIADFPSRQIQAVAHRIGLCERCAIGVGICISQNDRQVLFGISQAIHHAQIRVQATDERLQSLCHDACRILAGCCFQRRTVVGQRGGGQCLGQRCFQSDLHTRKVIALVIDDAFACTLLVGVQLQVFFGAFERIDITKKQRIVIKNHTQFVTYPRRLENLGIPFGGVHRRDDVQRYGALRALRDAVNGQSVAEWYLLPALPVIHLRRAENVATDDLADARADLPVLDIDVFDLVLDGLFVIGQILVYVAGAVHVVLTFKRVQRITDMLFQFRDVLIEPVTCA